MRSADCELNIQINTIEPGESPTRDADEMPPGESALTLNNIAINADKDGRLKLEAKAITYRYLDEGEIAKQRQEAKAAAKGKKR